MTAQWHIIHSWLKKEAFMWGQLSRIRLRVNIPISGRVLWHLNSRSMRKLLSSAHIVATKLAHQVSLIATLFNRPLKEQKLFLNIDTLPFREFSVLYQQEKTDLFSLNIENNSVSASCSKKPNRLI